MSELACIKYRTPDKKSEMTPLVNETTIDAVFSMCLANLY